MASGSLLLRLFVLCMLGTVLVVAFECSVDTTRICRRNIEDLMGGSGNTRKLKLEDQCTGIRENFDCVLFQTSTCPKEDHHKLNGDIILKSWRYLKGFCENSRNWWTKPCYQREDLKKCENLLSKKVGSTDRGACRGYVNFRDCATSVVENECSDEDQRLFGSYLVDKGEQKAWKCSEDDDDNDPASAPLAADTRQVDSRYRMYSDSSSYGCVYDARQEAQECFTKFEDIQKIALKDSSNDMKVDKICCGLMHYEECVEGVLRAKCGEDGAKQLQMMLSPVKAQFSDCKDHKISVCSGVASLIPFDVSILVVMLLPVLTSFYVRLH